MAGFRERDKRHFPLKSVQDVVKLFRDQLENCADPDLTLLSIVAGAVESCLTTSRPYLAAGSDGGGRAGLPLKPTPCFPVLQLATAEALYQRFVVHVKGNVDLTKYEGKYATRDFVKKVSDVIWNSLSRSFKDKAHLQSLYSYLTGNKLDCFGVALAVVAGCQILGYNDVHLALSEDHAWVVYGENSEETAEVTWHGKGNEDKRGLPVGLGVAEKSWLYLNGHAVVCNRQMEVASIVSGMNPAINSSTDSVEMGALQQELLWLLHDLHHLDTYPMALGNLGDLEEITPTPSRLSPEKIFQKAIEMSVMHYKNMHVYPYTYLGGYYYRRTQYKEAVKQWAEAAQVISKYNYNREDEEIYKEFLEIANELIPHIVKHACNVMELIKPNPLIQDAACYSLLLQFYDGICQWEEDSNTPVLHITWAKHLVQSLSKFHGQARANIHVEREEGDTSSEEEDMEDGTENKEQGERGKAELKWKLRRDSVGSDSRERRSVEKKCIDIDLADDAPVKRGRGRPPKRKPLSNSVENADNNNEIGAKDLSGKEGGDDENSEIVPSPQEDRLTGDSSPQSEVGPYEEVERDPEEQKIKSTIEKLASKVGEESQNQQPNPSIAALAQACGDSILNPNFLLGVGEPFTTKPPNNSNFFNPTTDSNKVDLNDFLSTRSNNNPFLGLTVDAMFKTDKSSQVETENSVPSIPAATASAAAVSKTPTTSSSSSSTHSTCSRPSSSVVSTTSLTTASLQHTTTVMITNGGGHSSPRCDSVSNGDGDVADTRCDIKLNLYSAKMRGLKELLCAEKLNASAINLQLTAQSQVHLKHSKVGNDYGYTGMRKRPRRE